MAQDVRDLLTRAMSGIEADPRLGRRITARSARRRPRGRLLLPVALAAVLAVLVAVVVAAPWRSDVAVLTPAASPTASEPVSGGPDDPLLEGPVGPDLPGSSTPTVVQGRALVTGTVRKDGRNLDQVIFAVAPVPDSGGNPYAFCVAFGQPGTPLRDAKLAGCPSGGAGNGPAPAGYYGEQNSASANTAVYGPAALTTLLRKDVVRADIKLAFPSDLPATATPDGGRPPIRKRLPLRLYGGGDPRIPYVLGVFDPVPAGYTTVGTDAWDAQGRQIVTNSTATGTVNLHGQFCGVDPQRPTAPYEPCPR